MLFLLFLLHHSYVFGQAFSDQADFAHIADQSGLPGLLSNTLKLPSSAWGVSAAAKAFSSFANAIVIIDNKHQELCCKCEAKAKCQAQDYDIAMAGLSPAPSVKHKADMSPSAHHLNINSSTQHTLSAPYSVSD
ncbi:hypothetical protein E4T56_gene18190 [Termitomyces sp. T112]|nr:hypothetical protein E4T56_gene18190 [Termitomyces sp. T112]